MAWDIFKGGNKMKVYLTKHVDTMEYEGGLALATDWSHRDGPENSVFIIWFWPKGSIVIDDYIMPNAQGFGKAIEIA